MTFFRREADRLDSYLDDHVAGRSIDPDDLDSLNLDPALIETWTWATTAMAHMPSDPDAKSDTWRTIMQSHAIAAPFPGATLTPPVRRYDEVTKPRWSHRAMAFVGTAALAAGLAVGVVGFDRFGGGGAPNRADLDSGRILLPAGHPGSHRLRRPPPRAGCDRADHADARHRRSPYFPTAQRRSLIGRTHRDWRTRGGAVDGTTMWMNSSPDDSVQGDIQADARYPLRLPCLCARCEWRRSIWKAPTSPSTATITSAASSMATGMPDCRSRSMPSGSRPRSRWWSKLAS